MMNKTNTAYKISNCHSIKHQLLFFILIIFSGLIFFGCSDNSDGDASPDETPINLTDSERIDLTKDALYASYAGIGHSSIEYQDNALLYNIMMEELNQLCIDLGLMVLNNTLYDKLNTLKEECTIAGGVINYFCIGNGFVDWLNNDLNGKLRFANNNVSTTVSITNNRTGNPIANATDLFDPIRLHITADFNPSSTFSLSNSHDVTYSGSNNKVDFEAYLDGYISFEGGNGISIIAKGVHIITHNSLLASYDSHHVKYQEWEISYTIDMGIQDIVDATNVFLIPEASGFLSLDTENARDNRDYTLKGEFTIDSQIYKTTGIHYIQEEQDDGTSTISVSGDIRVPEVNLSLKVNTPVTITCDNEGVWTGGKIEITIDQDVMEIDFQADGSATINGNEAIFEWQQSLDPLN